MIMYVILVYLYDTGIQRLSLFNIITGLNCIKTNAMYFSLNFNFSNNASGYWFWLNAFT